jgi:hypothetical protein
LSVILVAYLPIQFKPCIILGEKSSDWKIHWVLIAGTISSTDFFFPIYGQKLLYSHNFIWT